ncbi:hypothetical protein DAMA08_026490 [Martiniozyma asiatica (nom. inval.)]|nr:hypothetical protein DAMA08_026490 [Martiniozyma asiatica]
MLLLQNNSKIEVTVEHNQYACVRCRRLKKRCSKELPSCANCAKASDLCEYVERKNKRKSPPLALGDLDSDQPKRRLSLSAVKGEVIRLPPIDFTVREESNSLSLYSLSNAPSKLATGPPKLTDSIHQQPRPNKTSPNPNFSNRRFSTPHSRNRSCSLNDGLIRDEISLPFIKNLNLNLSSNSNANLNSNATHDGQIGDGSPLYHWASADSLQMKTLKLIFDGFDFAHPFLNSSSPPINETNILKAAIDAFCLHSYQYFIFINDDSLEQSAQLFENNFLDSSKTNELENGELAIIYLSYSAGMLIGVSTNTIPIENSYHEYFFKRALLLIKSETFSLTNIQILKMLLLLQLIANFTNSLEFRHFIISQILFFSRQWSLNKHLKTDTLLDQEDRNRLFWSVYLTDCYFSFILGTSNNFLIENLNIPLPQAFDNQEGWKVQIWKMLIKVSHIQANVSENLYPLKINHNHLSEIEKNKKISLLREEIESWYNDCRFCINKLIVKLKNENNDNINNKNKGKPNDILNFELITSYISHNYYMLLLTLYQPNGLISNPEYSSLEVMTKSAQQAIYFQYGKSDIGWLDIISVVKCSICLVISLIKKVVSVQEALSVVGLISAISEQWDKHTQKFIYGQNKIKMLSKTFKIIDGMVHSIISKGNLDLTMTFKCMDSKVDLLDLLETLINFLKKEKVSCLDIEEIVWND